MSALLLSDLEPGTTIGKYRVERVIGEGAMGVVVEATNLDLDQRVALKFMRDDASANEGAAERFAREARATARLKSEHVARVFDVGTYRGAPFIVMELLEGRDLEAMLQKSGPLPIATTALFVVQACEALAEAHSRGIVHRDVKPANVFIVDRPGNFQSAKLLDFGVSKILVTNGSRARTLKETSGLVGSPCYIAPEQFRGDREARATSDVWGLGLVLFEALTGTSPFAESERAGDLAGLMHAITTLPHPRVSAVRPEVPEALSRIVDWCLEKDPGKRCPSAADLASALLPFAPDAARQPAERALAMTGRVLRRTDPPSAPPPPVAFDPPSVSPRVAAPPSLARGTTRVALAVIGFTCLGLWFERGRRADLFQSAPPAPAATIESRPEPEPTPAVAPLEIAPVDQPAAIDKEIGRPATKRTAAHRDPSHHARSRSSATRPAANQALATETNAVDARAVNAAVRAHSSEVQSCIDKARAQTSVDAVRGKLAVRISLDATGDVTAAAIESSTLASRDLEACILAVIDGWKLPAPANQAPTRVTYSFVFR